MTRAINHIEVLRSSSKFRQWHPDVDGEGDGVGLNTFKSNIMAEKHFKPEELAELWGGLDGNRTLHLP